MDTFAPELARGSEDLRALPIERDQHVQKTYDNQRPLRAVPVRHDQAQRPRLTSAGPLLSRIQSRGGSVNDSESAMPPPIGLVVVDNKSVGSDFRKYMMRAAIASGGEAVHVRCWDELALTYRGEVVDTSDVAHQDRIVDTICSLLGERRLIVLVGLGTGRRYAPLVRGLRHNAQSVTVVYDVFDYFRYGARGRTLLRRLFQDLFWRKEADRVMVLERGLRTIYPSAFVVENASHVRRVSKPEAVSPKHAVYIGSIDRRVDFQWLRAFASYDITLDIYGRAHEGDPNIAKVLDDFVAAHPNVRFVGSYDNDDLPSILCKYRIGIMPYKQSHTMTRHVNPDKVYHYLNAGLEVITTDIPQTRRMERFVHLVSQPEDIAKALVAAQTDARAGSWSLEENSWDKRWMSLVSLSG